MLTKGDPTPRNRLRPGRGLEVATPFGPITYRAQDNQSTMGAYIGKTACDEKLARRAGQLPLCRRQELPAHGRGRKKLRPVTAELISLPA